MSRVRSVTLKDGGPTESLWPYLNPVLYGSVSNGGRALVTPPRTEAVDWAQVFGRCAPLTLEIGFSRGRFLRALGATWRDHDHVGIEIRRKFAWHVVEELVKHGEPTNVRVLWGDAKVFVPTLFAPSTLAAVFINFPDPWWKRRHGKRRLAEPEFTEHVVSRVKPGGRIWLKTDVEATGAAIQGALGDVGGVSGPYPFSAEALPPTFRERACQRRGDSVLRFFYVRNSPG